MAFEPCPGCGPNSPTNVFQPTATAEREQVVVDKYEAKASDIIDQTAGEQVQPDLQPEGDGTLDYTITWDMPDTNKERVGLAIAGGLAFLAPFVGFAVAARTARKSAGYLKPVGAGALTFFAMRAAAVGVLHYSGNLPNVSAATALGSALPQVPRRTYQLGAAGRAPCRGCR